MLTPNIEVEKLIEKKFGILIVPEGPDAGFEYFTTNPQPDELKSFIHSIRAQDKEEFKRMVAELNNYNDSDVKSISEELYGYFDFSDMDETKAKNIHEMIAKLIIGARVKALNTLLERLDSERLEKLGE